MKPTPRAFLEELFLAAVAAAHPAGCLTPHLPPPPSGRLIVLAAGKAAGAMTETAEQHYLDVLGLPADRIAGIAVTRPGYARPTRVVRLIEAGHPVPDGAGLAATFDTLALADDAGPDDLVLALVSGGASANWIAPALGISLTEKQSVTRSLLASGAAIDEMNTLRKHLSRIKGGRLAQRAHPARVVTVAISDVPGDDPAVIGSGPTVPDPTTLAAGARDRRALSARRAAVGRARSDRSGERNPEAGRSRLREQLVRPGRSACRGVRGCRGGGPPRPDTSASNSAPRSKARRAMSPRPMRERRRSSSRPGAAPLSCRAGN